MQEMLLVSVLRCILVFNIAKYFFAKYFKMLFFKLYFTHVFMFRILRL